MAQVPIHLARMAGVPDDVSHRRRKAPVADTIDVTDSVVTDWVVTDSPLRPDATAAPATTPRPKRVRPSRVRLAWGRRHA